MTSPETMISLAVLCRPAAVLLSATGIDLPNPTAIKLVSASLFHQVFPNESARWSESFWFNSSLPVLSVCPSMSSFNPGCASTMPASLASFSRAIARRSNLPVSNSTSAMLITRPRCVSRYRDSVELLQQLRAQSLGGLAGLFRFDPGFGLPLVGLGLGSCGQCLRLGLGLGQRVGLGLGLCRLSVGFHLAFTAASSLPL